MASWPLCVLFLDHDVQRVTLMRQPVFLTFIVLGISLFSFFTSGLITISLSDIFIGLLLFYALLVNRLMFRGPVFYATLCFAVVSLFSGIANVWMDPTFDMGNHMFNFVRIIGLVAMVLLLPPLQRRIGHDRLAQTTLWVIRLHAILVIADAFSFNPVDWTTEGIGWSERDIDFNRPRGLFVEPSFFGVYMGLSIFYILQVERNTGIRYIGLIDIILHSLSLIASTSLAAAGVLVLFFFELIRRRVVLRQPQLFAAVIIVAVLVGLLAAKFQRTGMGLQLDYVTGRVGGLSAGFANESLRVRILGSMLLTAKVLQESPLLGAGLGGANLRRLLARYGEPDSIRRSEDAILSLTFTPAAVIVGTGLVGFLPFVLIYVWILMIPETRLIGVSLVAVAFMWGIAFAPVLWWYICLAVSLPRWQLPQRQEKVSGVGSSLLHLASTPLAVTG
jgi:hypothetical protein